MTATHSSELQWLLVRNSSCFLVRRKGGKAATFTTEPYNLASKNSYKFNSLVNKKAVGVAAGPDNKGVILHTKRRKHLQKPATMFAQYPLVKGRRRSFRSIRRLLGCAGYRQDLIEPAVRRASAILASQRPVKRLRLKRRRR